MIGRFFPARSEAALAVYLDIIGRYRISKRPIPHLDDRLQRYIFELAYEAWRPIRSRFDVPFHRVVVLGAFPCYFGTELALRGAEVFVVEERADLLSHFKPQGVKTHVMPLDSAYMLGEFDAAVICQRDVDPLGIAHHVYYIYDDDKLERELISALGLRPLILPPPGAYVVNAIFS